MKKILLLSSVMALLLLSAFSFKDVIGGYKGKHTTVKPKATFSNCTASITSVTLVSVNANSATISFTYSGNPDHFVYGGYYNPTPNSYIPNTNTTSTTVTIPLNGNCGARVHFQCVCSDGTTVGNTHGVLFGCGGGTIYF